MKILICEESPTLALDLWWLLHEQGHSVCGIARSATKCLDRVEEAEPDLVIVDEDLEGHRGRDLVEVLSRSDVPAVMISGDIQSAAWVTSARAVLPKPFTEAALASVMARVGHLVGGRETAA